MIFCVISVNGTVSNQSNIVTLAGIPSGATVVIRGIGTSETSNVSIDIMGDPTLKSSHSSNVSVSQPRYIAIGYYI